MKKQIWEQLTCFLMAPVSWREAGQLSALERPGPLTHQPGPAAPARAPPPPPPPPPPQSSGHCPGGGSDGEGGLVGHIPERRIAH